MSNYLLRIIEIKDGFGPPTEIIAVVRTRNKQGAIFTEEVFASTSQLHRLEEDGEEFKALPVNVMDVDDHNQRYLVRLSREAASGAHNIWVAMNDVTQVPSPQIFEISGANLVRVNKWLRTENLKAIEVQRVNALNWIMNATDPVDMEKRRDFRILQENAYWSKGQPYSTLSLYEYVIVPTSVGIVKKVRHQLTGSELVLD